MGLAIITLILIVVFSTWIQTGIALWVAKLSAIVLAGLAAWALTKLFGRSQDAIQLAGWICSKKSTSLGSLPSIVYHIFLVA